MKLSHNIEVTLTAFYCPNQRWNNDSGHLLKFEIKHNDSKVNEDRGPPHCDTINSRRNREVVYFCKIKSGYKFL